MNTVEPSVRRESHAVRLPVCVLGEAAPDRRLSLPGRQHPALPSRAGVLPSRSTEGLPTTKTPGRLSSRIALVALSLAAALPGQRASAHGCQGDLVPNGSVNGADLGVLLSYWGPRTADPFSVASDIDGSGSIDGADIGLLLSNWGACPPSAPAWAELVDAYPDPDIVTDSALRAAIVATGLAWRVRDRDSQIEMLLIPPGSFQMGCVVPPDSEPCQPDEYPVHSVTLTNPFYLGRYEVTQGQWVTRMGSNPSYFHGQAGATSHPVEQVNWNSIQPFLAATSMRLPTEAEWEYACRAGTASPLHNGSSDMATLDAIAWFNLNSGLATHAVGEKAANGFGLHDMLGNVGEWVQDRFAAYAATSLVNPVQTAGSFVVMRGGGWGQLRVRSSHRSYDAPYVTYFGEGGFRVARDP